MTVKHTEDPKKNQSQQSGCNLTFADTKLFFFHGRPDNQDPRSEPHTGAGAGASPRQQLLQTDSQPARAHPPLPVTHKREQTPRGES